MQKRKKTFIPNRFRLFGAWLAALLLAAALLRSFPTTVYAASVPDLERRGSVSVTMEYDGEAVCGGSLSLYHVGDAEEKDGNYSFVLTGDFAESGADLSDISAPGLAKELAEFAERNSLTGTTIEAGEDGCVVFSDLEVGLYLILQKEAAQGYNRISPFLVTVPIMENGEYVYEVNAGSKMELTKAPDGPDEPDNPDTPDEPDKPGTPDKPDTPDNPNNPGSSSPLANQTLPQTGQLNWPVPVLAVLGLLLFSAGWLLRFGKKRDSDET